MRFGFGCGCRTMQEHVPNTYKSPLFCDRINVTIKVLLDR